MKQIYVITVILALLLVVGCSTMTGIFGKSSNSVAKQELKITQLNDKIADLQVAKINQVSQLSFGVDVALQKITNAPIEVVVAKELNSRVESIAGLPPLEQQKEMFKMVSDLIATNAIGIRELAVKDAQLEAIQQEEKLLLAQKNTELSNTLILSKTIALQADTTKSKLDEYRGWFGLNAVWMGLKQFTTTSFWVLIGIGILFLLLRVLATANPIAGAIFSVVDVFFSWIVNTIKLIAPKALSIANTVEKDVYGATKSALSSIIDSVETVKLTSAAAGKPATIEDLLNVAEASMSPADKALIEQIKLEMNWTTAIVVPTTTSLIATVPVTSSISIPTPHITSSISGSGI